MLYTTEDFVLSKSDVAKLTLQYRTTTLHNTGEKQAVIEASNDGFTWKAVASILPATQTTITLSANYIRLITDTKVVVNNEDPIARESETLTGLPVNLNTEALATKEELEAYATKQALQDAQQAFTEQFNTTTQVINEAKQQAATASETAQSNAATATSNTEAISQLRTLIADKADTDAVNVQLETKAEKTVVEQLLATVTGLSQKDSELTQALANKLTTEQVNPLISAAVMAAVTEKADTSVVTGLDAQLKQLVQTLASVNQKTTDNAATLATKTDSTVTEAAIRRIEQLEANKMDKTKEAEFLEAIKQARQLAQRALNKPTTTVTATGAGASSAEITNLTNTISELREALNAKADNSAITRVERSLREKAAQSAVAGLATSLETKADAQGVTDLSRRVGALETSKANTSDVDALTQKANALESNKADKTQLANFITREQLPSLIPASSSTPTGMTQQQADARYVQKTALKMTSSLTSTATDTAATAKAANTLYTRLLAVESRTDIVTREELATLTNLWQTKLDEAKAELAASASSSSGSSGSSASALNFVWYMTSRHISVTGDAGVVDITAQLPVVSTNFSNINAKPSASGWEIRNARNISVSKTSSGLGINVSGKDEVYGTFEVRHPDVSNNAWLSMDVRAVPSYFMY